MSMELKVGIKELEEQVKRLLAIAEDQQFIREGLERIMAILAYLRMGLEHESPGQVGEE